MVALSISAFAGEMATPGAPPPPAPDGGGNAVTSPTSVAVVESGAESLSILEQIEFGLLTEFMLSIY